MSEDEQAEDIAAYNEVVREILVRDGWKQDEIDEFLNGTRYFAHRGMTGQQLIDAGKGIEVEGVALALTDPW
jgi:hypothetical protein